MRFDVGILGWGRLAFLVGFLVYGFRGQLAGLFIYIICLWLVWSGLVIGMYPDSWGIGFVMDGDLVRGDNFIFQSLFS